MFAVKSIKGNRDYMEDRYFINLGSANGDPVIGIVCDGHGGENVAELTCTVFAKEFVSFIKNLDLEYSNIIVAKLVRDFLMDWGHKMKTEKTGSTISGFFIRYSTVFIFNIGDSRTCFETLGEKVYSLKPKFNKKFFVNDLEIVINKPDFFCTIDHDPETEEKRVTDAGGLIIGNRLNGILSLTRALGDSDIGEGLIHVPDIYWTDLSNVNKDIIIYSDGVYEPAKVNKENFTPEYLYFLAKKYGCNALVNYAYLNGSDDNITAIHYRF